MEIRVTGYKAYNFPYKQTGEIVSGVKLFVLDDYSDDEVTGMKTTEINVPYELNDKMDGAPAVYELSFDMVPIKGNKAKLVYKDIEKVKDFVIE
jgi:hypothetical protein